MDVDPAVFGPLPPLSVGEFAPWFKIPSPQSPGYALSSVGGRYVLLAFLPDDPAARRQALEALKPHRQRFDDFHLTCFLMIRDAATMAVARNDPPGLRWLFDTDGAVSRQYGALDESGRDHPHWLLLDPSLRILARAPIGSAEIFETIARLPAVADYAGPPLHAPVLIVPRVFEPQVCRTLIDLYEAQGGKPSGVMRDIGGKTVGVLDGFKSRRDATIEDPVLRKKLMTRIHDRLAPEIQRVFQFRTTRLERYIVACYAADEGGYFRPHRDNQTLATRHRRFAVSINLNAEEFEGGDLRFPEFGPRTYRPPTGGAVVFCCTLLHEATPVTRGRRYAFLPFLYDEEGARLRKEGEAFLAKGDAEPAEAEAEAAAEDR